jgi:hypothetical protein
VKGISAFEQCLNVAGIFPPINFAKKKKALENDLHTGEVDHTYIHILNNIELKSLEAKVGSNILSWSTKTNARVKRDGRVEIAKGSAQVYAIFSEKGILAAKVDATTNDIPSGKCRTIGFSFSYSIVAVSIVGMQTEAAYLPA